MGGAYCRLPSGRLLHIVQLRVLGFKDHRRDVPFDLIQSRPGRHCRGKNEQARVARNGEGKDIDTARRLEMFPPLRYALRQFRKSPGFSATAFLTLTLGIGASTAMFAVLDAVLLEPLPFAEPGRLVAIASQPDGVVSIPTMQDYQSRSRNFASLAAYRQWSPPQKATN